MALTFSSICVEAKTEFENGVADLIDRGLESHSEQQKLDFVKLYNSSAKGFAKKNAEQDRNAFIDTPNERAVDYLDLGHYERLFGNIANDRLIDDNFIHFVPDAPNKDQTILLGYLRDVTAYRNALTHGKRPWTKLDSILFVGMMRKVAHVLELSELEDQLLLREAQLEGDVVVAQLKRDNLPAPDYEDTGLIGRDELLAKVVRSIKKHHITSITGVGGVGKTALVVAACRKILSEDIDFDFIHYYSAKRNKLTDLDIKPIAEAIKDADTLFTNFSADVQQSGHSVSSDVDSLINYVLARKVILVIDNLETILNDTKLIEFLQAFEDRAEKSRLVITTRIGLKIKITQKDEPIPALSREYAKQLYNKLVDLIGKEAIFGTSVISEDDIDADLKLLRDNPLIIRNYISALRKKSRLEVVKELERGKAPLDFLMADVFDYLTEIGKELVYSLVYAQRSLLPLEIEFINDVLEDSEKRDELNRSRMDLSIAGWIAKGERLAGDDTFYAADVTQNFIKGTLSNNEKESVYSAKVRELDRMKTQYNNREAYRDGMGNFLSFDMSSDSGYLMFGLLNEAVELWKAEKNDEAFKLAQKAERINPEEAEVFRVSALLHSNTISGRKDAIDNYEQAISRKPDRIDYKLWYATFLMNNSVVPEENKEPSLNAEMDDQAEVDKSDLDAAEELLQECLRLEGERTPPTRSARLRRLSIDVKFRQRTREKTEAGEKELNDLIDEITTSQQDSQNTVDEAEVRKIHHLSVKSYKGCIDYLVKNDKKFLHEATDKLAKHVENYKRLETAFGPTKCMDARIEKQYRYLKIAIESLHRKQVKDERVRIEELAQSLPIGNLINVEILEFDVAGKIVKSQDYNCWIRPEDEQFVDKYVTNNKSPWSGIYSGYSNLNSLLSAEDRERLRRLEEGARVRCNIYQGQRGFEALVTEIIEE